MKKFLVVLTVAASPALGKCPAGQDITSAMDELVAEAQAAESDMAGRDVSSKMWQLWLQAPDEAAQSVLDRGMRARESYDYASALDSFNTLVDYCPDYAEGYNQRAFIHFLTQDFEAALVDLDKTLTLSPRHVGALSGRALTLMNLGRLTEARLQLEDALEINPWLSERFLMAKGGPLAPVGEDI